MAEEQQGDTVSEMDPKEILAMAGKRDVTKKVVVYDPLEKIPTLGVDDLVEGKILAGSFVETQRLISDKFTFSQETDPDTGKKVGYRHVLMNNGKKYGLWNCGELKLIFSKLPIGTYIELIYKGKGTVNGKAQHRFESKIDKVVAATATH